MAARIMVARMTAEPGMTCLIGHPRFGSALRFATPRSSINIRRPQRASRRNISERLAPATTSLSWCLDQDDHVWVMLHSGSRGLGNRIGQYFIEKAKEEMRKYFISLQDMDCAYLVEKSELFDDLYRCGLLAQDFALKEPFRHHGADPPRDPASSSTLRGHGDGRELPPQLRRKGEPWREECPRDAEGRVTRARGRPRNHTRLDGHGPGSMGTGSFIVRGRGNPDSFCSCSHGAGRRMSRADAKKNITLADHVAATAHVECRKDVDVIDESPAAYKDIGAVIAAQIDLIDVLHRLRGIVNVKG